MNYILFIKLNIINLLLLKSVNVITINYVLFKHQNSYHHFYLHHPTVNNLFSRMLYIH